MLATLISGGYRRELALIFDARGRGLNNPAIQEHKVQAPVDRLRFRRHPLFETDYSQPFSSQKKKIQFGLVQQQWYHCTKQDLYRRSGYRSHVSLRDCRELFRTKKYGFWECFQRTMPDRWIDKVNTATVVCYNSIKSRRLVISVINERLQHVPRHPPPLQTSSPRPLLTLQRQLDLRVQPAGSHRL